MPEPDAMTRPKSSSNPSQHDLTPAGGTPLPLPRPTLQSLALAMQEARDDIDELSEAAEKTRSRVDAVAADHGVRVTAIERLLEHVGKPPDPLRDGDMGTGLLGSVAYLVREKQAERARRDRFVYAVKIASAIVALVGAAIMILLNVRSLIGH
jgi:hypothetical protein